jgi:hypothetical protein
MSADLTVPPLPGPEVWHDLKCWPDYFAESIAGRKPFEIRKNDRGFKVGDGLLLREFNFDTGAYSGRECRARITSIIDYPPGLKDGYVVLGLAALLRAVPPLPAVAWTSCGDLTMDKAEADFWLCDPTRTVSGLVHLSDADAALASLQARLEAATKALQLVEQWDAEGLALTDWHLSQVRAAIDAATSQEGK